MPSKLSKPPAKAKPSKDFLLTHLLSKRFAKSKTEVYFPFSLRSLMIFSTVFSPTPLIDAIPKRISVPPGITANFAKPSLISGPRTFTPMRLHSSIKNEIESILPA